MFRVEKMCVDDFPFAVQLANTIDWEMTVEDYEFAAKLEPDGCFTLFSGSERAGISTCVSFGGVGWFGSLVVKDSDRRKGAGAFLVKHAMNYLKSKGAATIGLYTYPHLIGYYEQFGFKHDLDFLVFKGKAISPLTKEVMQLQTIKELDVPAVIKFDSQLFGASRKKLLEPILCDGANLGIMAVEKDEISGYCAAKIFGQNWEIGPLMCRRNQSGTACALLRSVLGQLRYFNIFVCVPAKENALLELLLKAGLQQKFQVKRMFLGPATGKGCTYVAESLERG